MAVNKRSEINRSDPQLADSNNPPIGTVTASFFVSMDEIFETCNVDDLEYFLKIVDEISLNIIEKSSFKNNSNNNVQNKITKSIIQKSDDRLNKQIEDKVMAAAVNMEVVKKDEWTSFIPCDNDKIELLQFVGGG